MFRNIETISRRKASNVIDTSRKRVMHRLAVVFGSLRSIECDYITHGFTPNDRLAEARRESNAGDAASGDALPNHVG
jgi:hypothetical protein